MRLDVTDTWAVPPQGMFSGDTLMLTGEEVPELFGFASVMLVDCVTLVPSALLGALPQAREPLAPVAPDKVRVVLPFWVH